MPQQYDVSAVAATREDWGWLVLLGDIEQMDGSPYLMFQLGNEFTENDRRLGQDQPYIEVNNQGWSWYGHIEHVQLRSNELIVQMDTEAQARMENDGVFVFRFSVSETDFRQVQQVLARIFAGTRAYSSAA